MSGSLDTSGAGSRVPLDLLLLIAGNFKQEPLDYDRHGPGNFDTQKENLATLRNFRRFLEIGFGPSHRLDCLVDFPVLLELEVELFALVGSRLNMRNTQLEKTLPVSLKRLVLWEEWWADRADYAADGYDVSDREYWDDMLDMLRRFAISCKARCTNLATVHLKNYNQSALNRDAYREIKELFAEAGVEFDVDELRTRQIWDDDYA
ncbi:hypothetical protein DL767_009075 [Monosporascus sp. MG133]|nr:hypothetical protein DL767_009075 [Monosporascus sp. MG133]